MSELKDFKPYFENYLTNQGFNISKGNPCPICGGGQRKKNAFHYDRTTHRAKCFVCNWTGDFVDYLQETESLSKAEAIEKIKTMVPELKKVPLKTPIKEKSEPESVQDFRSFYRECFDRADQCDYLQKRGISVETQKRFMIGFCPDWKHPRAGDNAPKTPRIIIPTARGSYLARDTRSEIPEAQRDYKKMKVGKVEIFNRKVLTSDEKIIFIVEGEIDALSVIEVGEQAVGLGSISNIRKLIDEITSNDKKFIIIPDNDENGAGQNGAEKMKQDLDARGLISIIAPLPDEIHDANDFLVQDRESFNNFLKSFKKEIEAFEMGSEFKSSYVINEIDSFLNEITSGNNKAIPTGFKLFDKALDGGIFSGLFIIGAESSLGKSAFVLNVAEQIAEAGTDVIYFSLEMSKRELIARGLSRQTFLWSNTIPECFYNKSTKEILKGNPEEYKDAIQNYKPIAKNLVFYEDTSGITVDDLVQYVENHIKYTGRSPVVVLDYLQLIAPRDPRDTDKFKIDYTVKALKQLSQKINMPVIAISSLNRGSYGKRVDMESFKESGAIEYSSDVLIGMSLSVTMDGKKEDFEIARALKETPRRMTVEILKNRNGERNYKIEFKYFSAFNTFVEDDHGFSEFNKSKNNFL